MLVLTRKRNEGITIGDHIHIVVVEIHGDKVRLGIDAPRDVSVHRDEVYASIHRGFSGKCVHEFPKGACTHQDCSHYPQEGGGS